MEERRMHHEKGGGPQAGLDALRDAEALDAIDYPWEPEVEPWPEEVHFRGGPMLPAGVSNTLARDAWGSRERYEEALREAQRRWKGYHVAVRGLKQIVTNFMSASSVAAANILEELGEEVPK